MNGYTASTVDAEARGGGFGCLTSSRSVEIVDDGDARAGWDVGVGGDVFARVGDAREDFATRRVPATVFRVSRHLAAGVGDPTRVES